MDVLIVDDDQAVRAAYQRALERAGYMVKAVDNGLAAFAELQHHKYRVLICDIQMPFLKGYNLFEELKTNSPEVAERVIFVTGLAERDDMRDFLQKSGRPFLIKPVDLKDLVGAVESVVEGT